MFRGEPLVLPVSGFSKMGLDPDPGPRTSGIRVGTIDYDYEQIQSPFPSEKFACSEVDLWYLQYPDPGKWVWIRIQAQ